MENKEPREEVRFGDREVLMLQNSVQNDCERLLNDIEEIIQNKKSVALISISRKNLEEQLKTRLRALLLFIEKYGDSVNSHEWNRAISTLEKAEDIPLTDMGEVREVKKVIEERNEIS